MKKNTRYVALSGLVLVALMAFTPAAHSDDHALSGGRRDGGTPRETFRSLSPNFFRVAGAIGQTKDRQPIRLVKIGATKEEDITVTGDRAKNIAVKGRAMVLKLEELATGLDNCAASALGGPGNFDLAQALVHWVNNTEETLYFTPEGKSSKELRRPAPFNEERYGIAIAALEKYATKTNALTDPWYSNTLANAKSWYKDTFEKDFSVAAIDASAAKSTGGRLKEENDKFTAALAAVGTEKCSIGPGATPSASPAPTSSSTPTPTPTSSIGPTPTTSTGPTPSSTITPSPSVSPKGTALPVVGGPLPGADGKKTGGAGEGGGGGGGGAATPSGNPAASQVAAANDPNANNNGAGGGANVPANADNAALGINDNGQKQQLADLARAIGEIPGLLARLNDNANRNAEQQDPSQIADRLNKEGGDKETAIPAAAPFNMPPLTPAAAEKEPREKNTPEQTAPPGAQTPPFPMGGLGDNKPAPYPFLPPTDDEDKFKAFADLLGKKTTIPKDDFTLELMKLQLARANSSPAINCAQGYVADAARKICVKVAASGARGNTLNARRVARRPSRRRVGNGPVAALPGRSSATPSRLRGATSARAK